MTDATFRAVNGTVSIQTHSPAAQEHLDALSLDFPLTELSGVFSMDAELGLEVARAMLASDLELDGVSNLPQVCQLRHSE